MNNQNSTQKKLLLLLGKYQKKLNMAVLIKSFTFSLLIGSIVAFLLQGIAMLTPFYYANLYSVLSIFLALLCGTAVYLRNRYSLKQTAVYVDKFGFDERMITAFENIRSEEPVLMLQRENAYSMLLENKELIKISFFPPFLQIAGVSIFFCTALVLSFFPSETKSMAKQNHEIKKEAEAAIEEIDQVIDQLENLPVEDLSDAEHKEIQDMIESLESSLSEYKDSSDMVSMEAANDRLNFKYDQIKDQLKDITGDMENMPEKDMTVKAIMELVEQLDESHPSADSFASGNTGNGQNGQGNGNQNGQGDGSQNGQGDGDQNGQGDGSQNGQGNGDQNGQGDGSQNGQGDGSQNGQGSGNNGRGEGSAELDRDFVSVPNEFVDIAPLHGTGRDSDTSEYFRMPNGMNWKGIHRPIDSVIGSYEQNAYDRISNGRYPESMSEIIKDYFSRF